MATPNYSEEEILFRRRARRRLVGAVVLVVAVVAIVPMILPESKPQQDTQQIEIRIPAQDGSGYTSKITPVPESPQTAANVPAAPTAEQGPPSVTAAPSPAPEPVKAVEAKPATLPVIQASKPETKPADAAKPTPIAKPAAAAKQAYYVQYGAFSESKNAKQRQAELKAKGINTFTEVVKTAAGDKIRVRSGPYGSRDDAEKIRTKVKPLDSKLVVTGGSS